MADLSPTANGHTANGTAADEPAASSAAATVPAPDPFSLRRNVQQLPPISAFLCVALGGALGALLRYGFIEACAPYQTASTTSTLDDGTTLITLHKPFPAATFISNLLGTLTIGLLTILLPTTTPNHHTNLLIHTFLITGLLGALTTMSSFALDTAQLWQRQASQRADQPGVAVVVAGGREWVGVVYWVGTNVGGVGLVVLGRAVGRWVVRRCGRRAGRGGDGAVGVGADGLSRAGGGAERAVVREVVEEQKEQAVVERGTSLDAPYSAR